MRNSIWRKGLVIGILHLFVTASIVSAFNTTPSHTTASAKLNNWLYVGGSGPGNYTKIQDAIDASLEGDTIFIYDDSSPYNESLNIYKSIRLLGEDKTTTIIDFNPNYQTSDIPIINIHADHCSIENLHLTLSNTSILAYGIMINSSSNTIKNTIITSVTNGIELLEFSASNRIINNEIRHNLIGIDVLNSRNNTISNNTLFSNTLYNMYLSTFSNNNTIAFNTIIDSYYGIRIKLSNQNTICNNCINYNYVGVYCCCGAESNYIYNNNLINNSENANENSGSINIWYNYLTRSGNYWDDYTGVDTNSDGIGDTPYTIPNAGDQDLYPSMKPYSCVNHPPSTPIITGPTKGKIGAPYTYSIQSIDLDQHDLVYFVDWDDGTIGSFPGESGEEITISHIWGKKGTYTIKVQAVDEYYAASTWVMLPVSMPCLYKPSMFFGLNGNIQISWDANDTKEPIIPRQSRLISLNVSFWVTWGVLGRLLSNIYYGTQIMLKLSIIDQPEWCTAAIHQENLLFVIPEKENSYQIMYDAMSVWVDDTAPAFESFPITIQATIESVRSPLGFFPIMPRVTKIVNVTCNAAYQPLFSLHFPAGNIIKTPPLTPVALPIGITNLGNGKTIIQNEVVHLANDFTVTMPSQVIFDINEYKEINITIIAPEDFISSEATMVVGFTPHYYDNYSLLGETIYETFLVYYH